MIVWQTSESKPSSRGEYVPLTARADGVHGSRVFPGLWLDLRALLAGDERKVAKVLERGLKSADHSTFVRRLQAAGR